MIVAKAKALLRPLTKMLPQRPRDFLSDVSGVVHVGANTGQERETYRTHGLTVIWVEPIPAVFAELRENIRGFQNQYAFQALVTDIDDKEYQFHIANNNGASSSILDLKYHRDIWPGVTYTTTISLRSVTLATLFKREHIDPIRYQALIMDTQGSELLVLQGSLPILKHFEYIKTEVADFESYEGCCQLSDVRNFMAKHGYKELSHVTFATRPQGGNYLDIIFKRR